MLDEEIPASFISRLSTFKEKLCECVGDTFYFHQPMNRDIHNRQMLMIPLKCLHKLLETAGEDADKTDSVSNESDIMNAVHAALICRKSLSEHSGCKGLNVSKDLAKSIVPDVLSLFLSVVMKGQEAVDDYFDSTASASCSGAEIDSGDYNSDFDDCDSE